jgi:hypothetical protein
MVHYPWHFSHFRNFGGLAMGGGKFHIMTDIEGVRKCDIYAFCVALH